MVAESILLQVGAEQDHPLRGGCRTPSTIKQLFLILATMLLCTAMQAQTLRTHNPMLDSAFSLAVWTIDHNTHNGILEAGGGYGGEWTRDASINCWNAASLLRPQVAENSLWSVTEDSVRIGHQYWDKILWTIAAWHHYQTTADTTFLRKAYTCASLTMKELETLCYDAAYGLFMGPAVFQDGIEAYPEPVFDPGKWDDSYVLHHPHSDSIRCLSTNVVYALAYMALSDMELELGMKSGENYRRSMELSRRVRQQFYDEKHHRFCYLIDHKGQRHPYQEGLGVSLALLDHDVLGIDGEPQKMVKRLKLTRYGIPSVSPSFPRNSKEKPGRHNMMIWPHINAFYAVGCAENDIWDEFYRELENMARLAMVNGEGDFYEIYTIDGEPSGGWQCRALWDKKEHQTWCATGYLRMWIDEVFGLSFFRDQLTLLPVGMKDGSECTLSGIHWRGNDISITVRGRHPRHQKSRVPRKILLNGEPTTDNTIHPNQGRLHYDITL